AVLAAVVVAYPVSDIAGLDAVTHRFESHYNRFLMGSPIDTERSSRERSPIHRPAALTATPILLFHGTEDPVVPIDQSIRLAESIRAHGGLVEDVVFDGEGHGFRRRESKIVEFERTEQFLRRHLGVTKPLPADRDR
ncbi:MAG: alpha/beta hydrolase family protein, partial [Actinomycetota bacterium]